MADLGEIKARLTVDTAQFSQGLEAARTDLQTTVVRLRDAKGRFVALGDAAKQGADGVKEAFKGIGDTLKTLKFKEISDNLKNISGGTNEFFKGLVGGALKVSANFEQLRAKLVSVTGSVEEANRVFKFAKEFAASTPFDVQGIVDAAGILGGFKQDIEGLLPVAANLASAMGKDLKEATLTLAKAASGGSEGFESLRNEYAITTKELIAFGAAQGKIAGQLSHAEGDIEKNRAALIKLINTRYGDAVARQAATLAGAVSNAEDAAANLADGFASTLVPAATAAAKGLAGLLEGLNSIPAPIKAAVAAATVFAAGATAVGLAVAGTAAGVLLLQSSLVGMGEAFPVALSAAKGLEVGLAGVAGAAGTARAAFVGLATNPLVIALTAVGAVAGLAQIAISDYESAMVKAGEAVAASTRKIAAANVGFRQGIALVNEAAGKTGPKIAIVADAAKQIQQIQNAFKSLAPESFAQAMDNAGVSTDDFKAKLQQSTSQTKLFKEQISAIQAEIEELSQVGPGIQAKTGIPPEQIRRIAELKHQLEQLQFLLKGSDRNTAFFQGAIDKAAELSARIEPLIQQSKILGTYLDLSKNIGTNQSLASALADVQAQIAANAQEASVASDNLDVLLSKFKALGEGPNTAPQRELIQRQIKLIQDRDSILEEQQKRAKDASDKAVSDEELAFRRSQALNGEDIQAELDHVNERLKIVQQGSEQEVALLEDRNRLVKQLQDQVSGFFEDLGSSIAGVVSDDVENSARQAEEAAKKAQEALRSVNQEIDQTLSRSQTDGDKLITVEAGILAIQKLRKQGLIAEADAQEAINGLTTQKLNLEQQIAASKQQQQNEIDQLALQILEQELEMLEQKKAKGINVEAEITANRQAQTDARLAMIEKERLAAIKAGEDEALANQTATLKKEQLANAETLRKGQELAKQEAAQDKSLAKQESRQQKHEERMQAARLGGKNSPLKSFDEAFTSEDEFSLGDFSLSDKLRKVQDRTKFDPSKFEGQKSLRGRLDSLDSDIARASNPLYALTKGGAEKLASLRAERAQAGGLNGLGGDGTAPGQSLAVDSKTLVVNGSTISDPELTKLVNRLIDAYFKSAKHKQGDG